MNGKRDKEQAPGAGIDLTALEFDASGALVGLPDQMLDAISGGLQMEEADSNGHCIIVNLRC